MGPCAQVHCCQHPQAGVPIYVLLATTLCHVGPGLAWKWHQAPSAPSSCSCTRPGLAQACCLRWGHVLRSTVVNTPKLVLHIHFNCNSTLPGGTRACKKMAPGSLTPKLVSLYTFYLQQHSVMWDQGLQENGTRLPQPQVHAVVAGLGWQRHVA